MEIWGEFQKALYPNGRDTAKNKARKQISDINARNAKKATLKRKAYVPKELNSNNNEGEPWQKNTRGNS